MLAAAPAAAGGLIPDACTLGAMGANPGGCTICHLGVLVINITSFLIKFVAIPLAGLLIAIGGITLLISGGSESMVKRGKQTLTYSIAGIAIVLLAWLAVDTIIKVLTAGDENFTGTFGPWHDFPAEKCGIK